MALLSHRALPTALCFKAQHVTSRQPVLSGNTLQHAVVKIPSARRQDVNCRSDPAWQPELKTLACSALAALTLALPGESSPPHALRFGSLS